MKSEYYFEPLFIRVKSMLNFFLKIVLLIKTKIFVEPSFIQYTELTQEVLEVTDKILYQD